MKLKYYIYIINKNMSLPINWDEGYLEIIIGSMFSGKTSKIIELYKQFTQIDVPCFVINHSADNRYSKTELSSHDKVMIPCVMVKCLNDIFSDSQLLDEYQKSKIILINEAQFFDDLYDWVKDQVDNHHKHIFVSGLDGDYMRNKFGQILDLIPICDKVSKITSLCNKCKTGKMGIFSKRIDCTNGNQMMIGSDEMYIPVCRDCYINKTI